MTASGSELQIDWPETNQRSLNQLEGFDFTIGDSITGLNGENDINQAEKWLVRTLAPDFDESMSKMTAKPLSTIVRPKIRGRNFNGQLKNGLLVRVATDIEQIPDCNRNYQVDETDVISTIFAADLYSSGKGIVASIARNIIYYRSNRSDLNGGVSRYAGSIQQIQSAAPVAEALLQESSTTAERLARQALRHVYSGGAPGLGKWH